MHTAPPPTPALLDPHTLVLHETVQPSRLTRLIAAMTLSQQIDRPVVVTHIKGVSMVLDGAHRTTSAQHLGLARLPAHIVQPQNVPPSIGWTHCLHGPDSAHALARIQALALGGTSTRATGKPVAIVRHNKEELVFRMRSDQPAELVRTHHELAGTYADLPYERVDMPSRELTALSITYQPLAVGQIIDAVRAAGPLPAGVTRFSFPAFTHHGPVSFGQLNQYRAKFHSRDM